MKNPQSLLTESKIFATMSADPCGSPRRLLFRWLCIFLMVLSGSVAFGQVASAKADLEGKTATKDSLVNLILDQVARVQKEQHARFDVVTNFEGKTEYWKITEAQNGADALRCIEVLGYSEPNLYKEVYVENRGQLIYGHLEEDFMPVGQYADAKWSCSLFFQDRKFVDMRSLGHGKTEDPNWDEGEIVDHYRKRKQAVLTFKK